MPPGARSTANLPSRAPTRSSKSTPVRLGLRLDVDDERLVAPGGAHARSARLHCFGDDDVGGCLDGRWAPLLRYGADAKRRPFGEGLERGGKPLVAEDGRMDAVRELSQLGDRPAQLGLGLVEVRRKLLFLIGSELPPQETQREREPDEALLSAVVEVALEAAAFGVARLNDAGTRGAEILELHASFGLQALVLKRQARRRRDFLDELRVVEEVGPVEQHCDGAAVANERRRRTSPHAGDVDYAPAGVRVPALTHRVGDLEPGITKRSGEPVSQTARGSRLAQLDDEPGKRRARAASPQ